MALTERLALLVTLDAQGAVKGFSDIGKAADRELGKADQKLDRLGSSFKKAGAGMLAAGGLAAAGLANAAGAASDLGETVSQTEQIFGDAAGSIGDFAKGAATSLGQSERAAREAANTFGLFFTNAGKSGEEAAAMSVELSKLASDMASFKNTSPEEAVAALGAALRGESEPIRTYGVMLDEATLKQRALDMGLIETTTGTLPPAIKQQAAYAEILAQTTTIQGDFSRTSSGLANQQRILTAEFENAKAAIGAGALPVMTKLTGVAADATRKFVELDAASGGLVSTIATIGTGGLIAAGGLSFVVGQAITMRRNLAALKGPLTSSTGGLNTLGKATAGLGFVGAGIAVASFASSLTKSEVNVDRLAASLADLSEEQEESSRKFILALDHFGKLDGVMSDMIATNAVGAERFIDLAESAGVSTEKIAEYRKEIEDTRTQTAQLTIDQSKNTEAVNKQVDALGGIAGAAGEAAPKINDLGRASGDAAQKTRTLAEALEDTEEAFSSLYDAVTSQNDADLAYRRALDSTEDSLSALSETTKEHGRNSEEYRRALLDAESALYDQADAAAELFIRTAEAGGAQVDAADKAAIHKSALEGVRDTLAPNSPLRRQLDEYIYKLAAIPGQVKTSLLVDAGGSFKTMADYLAYLDAINAKSVTGFTSLLEFKQKQLLSGTRAIGGPVSAGSSYLVNEYGPRGPEIFTPAVNGTVTPGGQLGIPPVSETNNITIINPVPELASTSIRKARAALRAS